MGDSGAAARHAPGRDDPLASSPTIQNGLSGSSPRTWAPQDQRRASVASSVQTDDFENWTRDEHEYLDGLKREPEEDSLKCDYVEALEKLWEAMYKPFLVYGNSH